MLFRSEHSIYKMNEKKKGNKVDYSFYSEKDIFDFLGLEYKSPIERIDGRAIIFKPQSLKKPKQKLLNQASQRVQLIKSLMHSRGKQGLALRSWEMVFVSSKFPLQLFAYAVRIDFFKTF